jgi:hypothetical protein
VQQLAARGVEHHTASTLKRLAVPLPLWILEDDSENTGAVEVFSSGFVWLLGINEPPQIAEVFEALAPLVERVSPEIIANTLRRSGPLRSGLATTIGWLLAAALEAHPKGRRQVRPPRHDDGAQSV